MSIEVGKTFGRYEVILLLGRGGMGEVYRARDTRLNRDVAIKVLPTEVRNHPNLKQRFEREALAISSLNHPHICRLYDVGEEGGVDYLVMEYLEGASLAQRLTHGPLTLEEVFKYGIQIAQALEAAHSQGIIHRDLKPGNILLTSSGAKLLDFGLAKLRESDALSVIDTITHNELTVAGTLLGTPQYMAPEQLHGLETDVRTDIFAFGAVLFEMITGRKAFEGKTQASLIAAILSIDPPPVSTFQVDSSPELDRLIQACLARDPEYRWQRASDIVNQLTSLSQGRHTPKAFPTSRPKQKPRNWWKVAALVLAGAMIVLGALLLVPPGPEPLGLVRFVVPAPEGYTATRAFALSPDGKQLAYVCRDTEGVDTLWLRKLNSYAEFQIKGTEGARYPFWSPDSRYVGFFASEKLKKVDTNDGFVQNITDTTLPRGGTWNNDHTIVFSRNPEDGLYRVSDAGGAAEPVTRLDTGRKETTHRWPQFLPDERRFLYYVLAADPQNNGIYVGSLDSKETHQLLASEWRGIFASPDYLVFTLQGKVFAQTLDLDSLKLKGRPSQLNDDIWHDNDISGFTSLSFSNNAMLAAWAGKDLTSQPVILDRSGTVVGKIGQPANISDFELSPDEQMLALTLVDADTFGSDIWVEDLERGSRLRLTFQPQNEITPVWSPDSREIVYSSDRAGLSQLYRLPVNSTKKERQITNSIGWKYPYSWSPDGKTLLYDVTSRSQFDVYSISMDAPGTDRPILTSEFAEGNAVFSPDSKWIAYDSDESGREEIYIQAFPPPGPKFQVSVTGGVRPVWGRDGKELFFLSLNDELMSCAIQEAGGGLRATIPRMLFPLPKGAMKTGTPFAVMKDGKRFIVNMLVHPESNPPIHVAINWPDNLKQ